MARSRQRRGEFYLLLKTLPACCGGTARLIVYCLGHHVPAQRVRGQIAAVFVDVFERRFAMHHQDLGFQSPGGTNEFEVSIEVIPSDSWFRWVKGLDQALHTAIELRVARIE